MCNFSREKKLQKLPNIDQPIESPINIPETTSMSWNFHGSVPPSNVVLAVPAKLLRHMADVAVAAGRAEKPGLGESRLLSCQGRLKPGESAVNRKDDGGKRINQSFGNGYHLSMEKLGDAGIVFPASVASH